MSFYLDPKCTTYDENTKKLVVGREAIIADIKANVASQGRSVSFTIDRPFVRVDGDRAIVTFVLIKETGGSSPAKFESHVSDVFVRRDGAWKKLHFFGEEWKKVM
jgi:ketosteroid isomerase-like protein